MIKAPLLALQNENDNVLRDILSDSPGFVEEISMRLGRFLGVALNSVIVPGNGVLLEQRDHVNDDRYSRYFGYMLGKLIKNVIIFTIESSLQGLNDTSKSQDYKYKLCEQNPNFENWPCNKIGNESDYNYVANDSRECILRSPKSR